MMSIAMFLTPWTSQTTQAPRHRRLKLTVVVRPPMVWISRHPFSQAFLQPPRHYHRHEVSLDCLSALRIPSRLRPSAASDWTPHPTSRNVVLPSNRAKRPPSHPAAARTVCSLVSVRRKQPLRL
ncbi:hypothetical protein FA13DRAFT_793206 [Coprinellus micaceus]|uniref:Uncharacterized protein n=1 Tax=Coprinellus micaceus TaxID=71717 RepID=A0A4Y7T2U6_COPMI|nr:hypothetical protein FA13DRAFT_793206 [Coprinellus micaceus]